MRVSIITPARIRTLDELTWLGECARSLQAQTMKDWEWVIADDASPIPVPKPSDPRIRTLKSSGVGVAAARNTAAGMARAELLYPLDADDELEPDCLEKLVAAWDTGGRDRGIVYPSVLRFGGGERDVRHEALEYDFERLLRGTYILVGALHRKVDWKRVGGWKPALESGLEDWEYWIAMAEIGVCGQAVKNAVYRYRRNNNGRLARLRSDETQWHLSYKKMAELHKAAFGGEIVCCGKNKNKPAPPSSSPSAPAFMAAIGQQGMVPVEYIGGNVGTTLWGPFATPQHYTFGNNLRDRVKYVDARDVDKLLAIRENKRPQFRLYTPPTPPAPAPEPKPEPAPEPERPKEPEPLPVVVDDASDGVVVIDKSDGISDDELKAAQEVVEQFKAENKTEPDPIEIQAEMLAREAAPFQRKRGRQKKGQA